MKASLAALLLAVCVVPMAQTSEPDLLTMPSASVALYVAAHTHPLGDNFGDHNVLCGPFVHSGTTTTQLCALIFPKDKSAEIYAAVAVVYHANLWNMYRSAVLDNNAALTISSDHKDFSDCDDDGCTYTESVVIDMPPGAFSKDRVGHKLGIRLYGDQHPTTVWLPAGYVAGFFTATTTANK
jgi:hypothetical protein